MPEQVLSTWAGAKKTYKIQSWEIKLRHHQENVVSLRGRMQTVPRAIWKNDREERKPRCHSTDCKYSRGPLAPRQLLEGKCRIPLGGTKLPAPTSEGQALEFQKHYPRLWLGTAVRLPSHLSMGMSNSPASVAPNKPRGPQLPWMPGSPEYFLLPAHPPNHATMSFTSEGFREKKSWR